MRVEKSRKEHRDHVRAAVQNDLQHHRVHQLSAHVWRCQAPGTWVCGFYVTCAPTIVAVTGDLGGFCLDHFWGKAWVLGSVENRDYFLGKLKPSARDVEPIFYAAEAEQELRELAEGAHGAEPEPEPAADIRMTWEASDYYGNGGLYEAIAYEGAWYEHTSDPERIPEVRDYSHRTLICYEALRWWASQLREGRVLPADPCANFDGDVYAYAGWSRREASDADAERQP